MIIDEKDLLHYGTQRHSGRYPWGSGGNNPTQRNKDWLDYVENLMKENGWSDKQCAEYMEMSSTAFRQQKSISKSERKAARIAQAQRLHDEGNATSAIGREMGLPESTIRTYLAPGASDKANVIKTTADMLRAEVNDNVDGPSKGMIDVGSGVENYLGVSKERKDTAIKMLIDEGYTNHYVKIPQVATGKETNTRVLAPPGTTPKEVYANRNYIKGPQKWSEDGGRSYFGIVEPLSISPKRLAINYAEDGGGNADGMIYIRPGVKDIELGNVQYAQVRVKIGNDHYIKGMAMYKPDMPDGVDLIFNTPKSDTGNKMDALKKLKDDPDNPFGAYIRRQIVVKDKDGNDKVTSAMNLVNEEGNWNDWSRSISSQVLSKQDPSLAKSQLKMTYEGRKQEYDDIMALTNLTVRKKLLDDFAEGTDAAAVHLDAAALPRQRWQVILPISTLPEHQVYAPNFRDGETVALIRYPHGGTFEIPLLTVNTKHADSKRILGTNPKDGIGIHPEVAKRLSGADFDGDTVLVIPNDLGHIRVSPALQGLRDFDARTTYVPYDGMKTVDGGKWNAATQSVDYGGRHPTNQMQKQMGDISNLITDMTIKNASNDEIARAVRHSMVVIDSEKHSLNYKQSAIDNNITSLKEKYQGGPTAGAATLISRASSDKRVPERRERRASEGGAIDPVTGERMYVPTGVSYVSKKTGKVTERHTKTTRLGDEKDAAALSSGTPMERIYVAHSNQLKALANQARLSSLNTPRAERSPEAARTYANEVASLNASLDLAVRRRPLERDAQRAANAIIKQRKDANPNMDAETLNKIKYQALEEARRRTGADKAQIMISQSEWEAIQAGAISDSKLTEILNKADMTVVREHATPRTPTLMTSAKMDRAASMLASGYPQEEVAKALGVSLSTLERSLSGE